MTNDKTHPAATFADLHFHTLDPFHVPVRMIKQYVDRHMALLKAPPDAYWSFIHSMLDRQLLLFFNKN